MRGRSPTRPEPRERWLAAVCYLSILVVLPMLAPDKSRFLARHCRQGFALLFTEVVVLLLLAVIDRTIGLIPILGFLISILLHLAFFLAFLVLSALGFVKALSGETWRIPALDELAERVPVHAHDETQVRSDDRHGPDAAAEDDPSEPLWRPAPSAPSSPAPADEEPDEHATRGGDAF